MEEYLPMPGLLTLLLLQGGADRALHHEAGLGLLQPRARVMNNEGAHPVTSQASLNTGGQLERAALK